MNEPITTFQESGVSTDTVGASAIRSEYFFWAAVLVAFFMFMDDPTLTPTSNSAAAAAIGSTSEKTDNPFDLIELTAKAAIVYDSTTKSILFEKNATTSLPLASITKVMTSAVALSLVPETTIITVEVEAVMQEGDSHLQVGEKWLLRDLVTFMLLESSNDAAYAISSSVGAIAMGTEDQSKGREFFLGEMNRTANKIGLFQTSFRSESGLDIGTTEAGAVSSAENTAKMFAYAIERFPKIFNETKWSELVLENNDGGTRDVRNTNRSIDKLPLLLASKTGYTDLAGGNLVIAFSAGFSRPIIIAVLGSTAEERFEDVEKLVWSTLDSFHEAN